MSNYPEILDTDENLFLVHDSLRLKLLEDYNPGDTSITIDNGGENSSLMARFPDTGIITLTEQCSNIDLRAISFFYSSKTDTTFEGLEILPGFTDVIKPKFITNVTMNVVAEQHNAIKDAVIAIETFLGTKGTIDVVPFGETIEGRLNFLYKLVFRPRAWFEVNRTIGLVPLEVEFTSKSFRLGDGDVVYLWNFGDNTISNISVISTISATDAVPIGTTNVIVQDKDGGSIKKTYSTPGKYTVSLTVSNAYGEDTVVFENLINARIDAPNEAVIDFIPNSDQTTTIGSPVGGPYTTPPTIRSTINDFIEIELQSGENLSTPGYSYAGEPLNMATSMPIDPVETYTWSLSDDLLHSNSSATKAVYSIGGLYDLKLRVDTESGAYRITTYKNAIDIIETQNLWLWTYDDATTVRANEFGLISETFKTASSTFDVITDIAFLNSTNNEVQAKHEFKRNTVFAPIGTTGSGDHGQCLLGWASGGPSLINQSIELKKYNGFTDTYSSVSSITNRPWNWLPLVSPSKAYFLFGQDPTILPNSNASYQLKTTYTLDSFSSGNDSLTIANYTNGAEELMQHISTYDAGVPTNGYFAVYRSAWKDNAGYFVRNDSVGTFYRIKSFYKTEGTLSSPVQTIKKLADIDVTKLEGELVALSTGVFFFNNSGTISAYNTTTNVWENYGPSSSSVSFRSLQDFTVSGSDSLSNSLLAASDGDRNAYLSYDYSSNAFVKFNGASITFSSLGARPSKNQWQMGVY